MIFHKKNGQWYMNRRLYFGTWTFMIAFDIVALFVLLTIMTWNTTHDSEKTETMLMSLWGIWFLIPGLIINPITCIGLVEVRPETKER